MKRPGWGFAVGMSPMRTAITSSPKNWTVAT